MIDKVTPTPERQDLLGFFTHPGTLDDYLNLANQCITSNIPCTVFYHNLHSLYCYFTSDSLRKYYADKTILVDGMGVLLLYRLVGNPLTRDHRLTYVDFIIPLMTLARNNGWRVFHLGQRAETQKKALTRIREWLPGVQIDGHNGYFDKTPLGENSLQVIRRINDNSTDILLVGLGAPAQEEWVHTHRQFIDAPVVFTCGACMEYVSGEVRTPPRWMGRMGLEWSFRLIENPRRFAFRFLIQPILLGAILSRNWIRGRY